MAALAVAVLSLLGVRAMLSPKETAAVERKAPPQTMQVLAAGRSLALGAKVKPEDLIWIELPVSVVAPTFFTQAQHPQAIEELSGATAKSAVTQGEILVADRFIKAGDRSLLAALLNKGFRAIGVPIKQETAAAGFILPNDRVDVILTARVNIDSPNGSNQIVRSNVVLEDVRVLAIDQTITPQTDPNGVTTTVTGAVATLELTPGDAETLTMAGQLGTLSLALRSVQDQRPLGTASSARPNAPALQQNVRTEDVVLLHADGKATPTTVLER
jgi:pilus assembly protein CpaB